MSETAKYLNLGCGNRFNQGWINIDIASNSPDVIAYNILNGIPLSDGSCEVVYHSHLLEHVSKMAANFLIKECNRVLKVGGIIRIAIPDLERICRAYLACFDRVISGDTTAASDYEWIMLELYDQTVRDFSGGEMGRFLMQNPLPNPDFVRSRIGEHANKKLKVKAGGDVKRSFRLDRKIRNKIVDTRRKTVNIIERVFLRILLGANADEIVRIGRFRLKGEIHQWMYDRYSLSNILVESGFVNPQVFTATTSNIVGWEDFHLDTTRDGVVVKPDSLFMEAVKK